MAISHLSLLLGVLGVAGGAHAQVAQGSGAALTRQATPRLVITEIMADPAAVPDERGEWLEVHNAGARPLDLRGYRVASANDGGHVIARSLVLAPGGYVVLARDADARANGGAPARYAYGSAIGLANGRDWIALRDPTGITVDSVAWRAARPGASWAVRDPAADNARVGDGNWQQAWSTFGAGDRGTPGRANDRYVSAGATAADPREGSSATELVVRVLDVGQGDAIYIANGASRALIDGGPDPTRLGRLLDSLGLNGTTIDVVVLSHQHHDHHGGLRELFRASRRIRVRFFFENQDASAGAALAELRDSVASRAARGDLVYRDTDDPCGDGRPLCTITMRGGARLHVMRPAPHGADANNRSAPLKLVGPDSASFTMWLAGDAEHDALRWFDVAADYDARPGMHVNVLKAGHHGSCNGVTSWHLRLTDPDWVVVSLAAANDYGHVHAQAKATYAGAAKPWYRTDENGTITIRSPGTPRGGYTIEVARGGASMHGISDRPSAQAGCNPVP